MTYTPGELETTFGNVTDEDSTMSEGTTIKNEGPNDSSNKVEYTETKVAKYIDLYGGGTIVVFGLVGNGLVIAVLRRKKFTGHNITIYFKFLAIADFIVIFVAQFGRHWTRALTGVDLVSLSDVYCKLWFCMSYTMSSYSIWILVGVSFERCLVTLMPLKSKTLITTKSAYGFLAVCFLCCFLYSTHTFMGFGLVADSSGGKVHYTCKLIVDASPIGEFNRKIKPTFEVVIRLIVPFIFIFVCNTVLAVSVITAIRKQRRELGTINTSHQAYITSLLVMLIIVSFAFIALLSPFAILRTAGGDFFGSYDNADKAMAVSRMTWAITLYFTSLNHAINFILYVLCGKELGENWAQCWLRFSVAGCAVARLQWRVARRQPI